LVTALPVLAEPAVAQDSGRIFRPFTAPLRSILRAPRPRMGVPRAKRPRAVQQRPSMRKKETVERARPERRQAAAAAAAAGAVGAAALWPSASPSAYEDMLGYALWPREYAARFWSHGPHDIMQAMTAPEAAAAAKPAERRSRRVASSAEMAGDRGEVAEESACIDSARDRALRPVERIPERIELTAEQRGRFDELRAAVSAAVDREASSCRKDLAGSPPERLRAVIDGLWAMRYAEFGIRTSLQSFYDSLTKAQKDDLNGDQTVGSSAVTAVTATPAELCGKSVGTGPSPFARLEQALRPTPEQQPSVKMLHGASLEMAQFLMTTCPSESPASPTARLDAAGDRVVALLHAAMNIEPLFHDFYGRLSDRQRTRLNATMR
jgi:hypothetical protein